jgi:hypothetical protein
VKKPNTTDVMAQSKKPNSAAYNVEKRATNPPGTGLTTLEKENRYWGPKKKSIETKLGRIELSTATRKGNPRETTKQAGTTANERSFRNCASIGGLTFEFSGRKKA